MSASHLSAIGVYFASRIFSGEANSETIIYLSCTTRRSTPFALLTGLHRCAAQPVNLKLSVFENTYDAFIKIKSNIIYCTVYIYILTFFIRQGERMSV